MKRVFSDKRILQFETATLLLMLAMAGSLAAVMYRVNLKSLPGNIFFNCIAMETCMILSGAIAVSIKMSHRVYERWHMEFMLIMILNYACMYLDCWVLLHSTAPSAADTACCMILVQLFCVLLLLVCFLIFIKIITDFKKLMNIILGCTILVVFCAVIYFIVTDRNPISAESLTQHVGGTSLPVSIGCLIILTAGAVPACFSGISKKWKIAVASYPVLFAASMLSGKEGAGYLFSFQAITLSCMCSYGLMYTDNEDPGKVSDDMKSGAAEKNGSVLEEKTVSVMKVSLRDFSYVATYMKESIAIDIIDTFLKEMMNTVSFFDGRVIAFPACSFIAVFGSESNNSGFRARAIGAAMEIVEKMEDINAWCKDKNYPRIYVSTTIVTDTMSMGYVGEDEYRRFTIMGEAIELCDRMEKFGGESEILVSESTLENYYSSIHMQKRGTMNKRDNTPMVYFKVSKGSHQE